MYVSVPRIGEGHLQQHRKDTCTVATRIARGPTNGVVDTQDARRPDGDQPPFHTPTPQSLSLGHQRMMA